VLLEPQVVKRAAKRISETQLIELERFADQMEMLSQQDDERAIDEIAVLNNQFHAELVTAADSPRLQRLLETIVQVPVSRRSFHHYTREELLCSMQHHREIIRALQNRDGEWAAAIMRAHILAARAAQMRQKQPGTTTPVERHRNNELSIS
jgi:DNA-binding GntR family transcriptional regulator